MTRIKKTGVIGLGRIGSGYVKNLLKAGFEVSVLDLNKERMEELTALGAVAAQSAAEMGASCSRIILSLFGIESVEAVLFGENGLTSRKPKELIVIDTTTIAPEDSRRVARKLAEEKIGYLDAPVTGGEHGAQSGNSVFMVGGSTKFFADCEDVFTATGSRFVLVGETGAGATAKMVNQLLMVAHMAGAAESVAYTEMQGVDFAKVLEAINPQLQEDHYVKRFTKMREEYGQNDTPSEPVDHYTNIFLKDITCILKLGKKQPIASAGYAMLKSAVDNKTAGSFPWTYKTGLMKLQDL